MNQLNTFTMIDYDAVKEEACMSFLSPNNGDLRKLWIHRDTMLRLVGVKRWDKNTYGEPNLPQAELKIVMLREFKDPCDVEAWFDTTANKLMQSKAQGNA